MTINVQFSDASEQEVIAYFASPQDAEAYPNQAQIDESDPRYLAFANPASTLAGARAAKIAELSAACKASIYAGFTSDALATGYTYPAKDTDQQNLASSVIDSLLSDGAAGWATPFWCADPDGVWAFRMHTAAQIQQVGKDAKVAVLAAMSKNQALVGRVAAAESVDAVKLIAWA
jgi:hypothetical protein